MARFTHSQKLWAFLCLRTQFRGRQHIKPMSQNHKTLSPAERAKASEDFATLRKSCAADRAKCQPAIDRANAAWGRLIK